MLRAAALRVVPQHLSQRQAAPVRRLHAQIGGSRGSRASRGSIGENLLLQNGVEGGVRVELERHAQHARSRDARGLGAGRQQLQHVLGVREGEARARR